MLRTGLSRWRVRRPQRGRQTEAVGFREVVPEELSAHVYNLEPRRRFQSHDCWLCTLT